MTVVILSVDRSSLERVQMVANPPVQRIILLSLQDETTEYST